MEDVIKKMSNLITHSVFNIFVKELWLQKLKLTVRNTQSEKTNAKKS